MSAFHIRWVRPLPILLVAEGHSAPVPTGAHLARRTVPRSRTPLQLNIITHACRHNHDGCKYKGCAAGKNIWTHVCTCHTRDNRLACDAYECFLVFSAVHGSRCQLPTSTVPNCPEMRRHLRYAERQPASACTESKVSPTGKIKVRKVRKGAYGKRWWRARWVGGFHKRLSWARGQQWFKKTHGTLACFKSSHPSC